MKAKCDYLQQHYDITNTAATWLAMLVTSRDIVIIPAANCQGHLQRRRQDMNQIDSNRDFAYHRKRINNNKVNSNNNKIPITGTNSRDRSYLFDNHCFLSSTARLFYYLTQYNLFQVSALSSPDIRLPDQRS